MEINYNKMAGAFFKAWMAMCGIVMAIYAAFMVVFLKWDSITDWFDDKKDRIRSKFGRSKEPESFLGFDL